MLYHEYIHALGFRRHDRAFRALERAWDETPLGRTDADALLGCSSASTQALPAARLDIVDSCGGSTIREVGAQRFAFYLSARRYQWMWVCPECGRRHHRKRRQNGRFVCRNASHERGVRLVDAPNPVYRQK